MIYECHFYLRRNRKTIIKILTAVWSYSFYMYMILIISFEKKISQQNVGSKWEKTLAPYFMPKI